MVLRGATICSRPLQAHALRCSRQCIIRKRFVATYNGHAPTPGEVQSHASPLAIITQDLDKIAPRFEINGDDIEILQSPSEFYETLKSKITNAERRIFLSTLYIGKDETELIDTIKAVLRAKPTVTVSILTDALRGTRELPRRSCATLLLPLVQEFGHERVELRMFHTPNLAGTKKRILPKRINEGWGLQHMKLYGVDDEIIMSGANLSEDYFTNRQDRYHVFRSASITNYFANVHDAICRMSYVVTPVDNEAGLSLEWPQENFGPAAPEEPEKFRQAAQIALQPLLKLANTTQTTSQRLDTTVYPLLQLTPLFSVSTSASDRSTELPALRAVLSRLAAPPLLGSHWTFTAGYFNMTPEVRDLLLATKPSSATVVGASPWANGFYGSKGISGMLPAAYTLLSRRFFEAVSTAGLRNQISVREWRRGTVNTPGGWTYHAKGVWVTLLGEQDPSINLVGSSNYTKRSYTLDLEANALVITKNAGLKQRYRQEQEALQEYTTPMQMNDYTKTERRVGLHVRLAMWIVTLVGGAL